MEFETIIFLHLPKAAGTTLHVLINNKVPESEYFEIDGNHLQESIKKFKNLDTEQKKRLKFIKGHQPFGLHKFTPNTCKYITLLREPVSRIVSHYYFVKRSPWHSLNKELVSANMSLYDYVSSDISIELDNVQTRFISNAIDIQLNGVTRFHYEIAKKNIQNHFLLAGVSEYFDAFLLILNSYLNWPSIYYQKANITSEKEKTEIITSDIREIIHSRNQWDMELYDLVKQEFLKKITEQSPDFNKKVKAFQLRNHWFQEYKKLTFKTKRFIKTRLLD